MNTAGQITVRQWFRLPEYERQQRITEFRDAYDNLQINSYEEELAGVREETETGDILNGRVNDLWPTVPWWVREPSTGTSPAVVALFERLGARLFRNRRNP